MKKKWVVSKKESVINSDGKLVPEKITFEKYKEELLPPKKKEFLDILIRSVTALSIFVPLILIYFQRQNEIKRENSKNISEIFTGVATDLQIVINENIDTKEYDSAFRNVLFKYLARIRLLEDSSLIQQYSEIIDLTKNYHYIKKTIQLKDSVLSQTYSSTRIIPRISSKSNTITDIIELKDTILVLTQTRKSILFCSDLGDWTTDYKNYLTRNKIDRPPDSVINFIVKSLPFFASNVKEEMYAFEDYLTDSTGLFNHDYLETHKTGNSIDSLSECSRRLTKLLELNSNKMEDLRSSFEKMIIELFD